MRFATLLFLFSVAWMACTPVPEMPEPPSAEEQMSMRLDSLQQLMIGNFNSGAQAEADTNFYGIGLSMCLLQEDSGKWFELYVEQALISRPLNPYRQRIYHVSALDSVSFVSEIYALDHDSLFVGSCASDSLKKQLLSASSYKKAGCDVILSWKKRGVFEGSTQGISCINNFGGATYATSVVSIDSTGIRSWDQGFDENGVKVWGPSGKGYEFLRE